MNQERQELYTQLSEQVSNTRLVQYQGNVPNGNQIFVKMESEQHFGSHYDRVFLELFKHYEDSGDIKPGDKVLETSSGSAGVSFAGLGAVLGYECIVAMPKGGEKAREEAVLKYLKSPDHLEFTPAKDYVNGFKKFIGRHLVKNRGTFFINHSMGKDNTNNEVTLKALEGIADEVLAVQPIDHFISAVGNGSNTLGVGRGMKQAGVSVTGYESFSSATVYNTMYSNKRDPRYTVNRFGYVREGAFTRHQMPGTSYPGIDFPHIRGLFEEAILDDVVLVVDEEQNKQYLAGHLDISMNGMFEHHQQQKRVAELPRWDSPIEYSDNMGRSSRAGLAIALNMAAQVERKNILILQYDTAERYDERKFVA